MKKIPAMLIDITNSCNVRCTFCVHDWSKHVKPVYMDVETFGKMMEVLPLSNRGLFSCNSESTTHPDFIKLFKRVPPRKTEPYTFVATNLAKKFTDEEIEDMSNLNLNSITVSVTSFNPKVYEEFHRGAKFDTFINNLERLASAVKQKSDAPELRFITIIFKQNMDELVHITDICNKKYLSVLNQFRTPFAWSLNLRTKEWIDKTIVSKEEYHSVEKKVNELPYKTGFFDPLYAPVSHGGGNKPADIHLFCRSDGTMFFAECNKEKLPEEFRGNLNMHDIDNPYEFFKTGLSKL